MNCDFQPTPNRDLVQCSRCKGLLHLAYTQGPVPSVPCPDPEPEPTCICYPNMCPLDCEPACPRCSTAATKDG